MRWIDLSAHRMKLVIAQLPSQRRLLVLLGAENHADAATRLGFAAHPQTGLWIKKGASFTPQDFKREFPEMQLLQDVDPRTVLRLVGGPKKQPDLAPPAIAKELPLERDLETLLSQSRPLGRNHAGHTVFEGPEGRFYEVNGQVRIEADVDAKADSLFLRATDDAALAACADGLMEEIAKGAIIRVDDFERFASAIYDNVVSLDDHRALMAFDAVVAASIRWLSRNSDGSAYENFNGALRLHESQPYIAELARRHADFRFLPFPIQVAALRTLGNNKDLAGKNIVVPNVTGATFLAGLPASAKVRGFVAKDGPLGTTPTVKHRSLSDGPADFTGADAIFGAYRKEKLGQPLHRYGIDFYRNDLVQILDALDSRTPEGRSVFLLDGEEGDDAEEFEAFRHLVARNFAIEGAVDVDGAVHGGLIDKPDMRLLVVGRRRPEALEQAPEPALRLRKAHDFQQLWAWTSEVVANRRKVAEFYEREADAGDTASDPSLSQNRFQTPYQAASRVGQATTMVPRNLEGATREALERVIKVHPDIDRWVAGELAMTPAQLGEVFSPEQVDALALEFFALDNGRAFLIADDTGIGKGRQIAGVMRRAALQGKRILFLTEKAMNLSDIWRDIRHIGAEDDFSTFILNNGVKIIDESTGDVVLRSRTAAEIRRVAETGEWPEGCNLVLATYGQFNRSHEVSAKAAWLRAVADKDVLLVTDEAQNATSLSSNTAKNLNIAKDKCAGPLYASATFAKNANNMAFFSKLFPHGMSGNTLIEIIRKGGETMQEIVSVMLARDGVLVRREHDLSKVTFETIHDEENTERNRRYTDILASILSEIGSLSGEFNRRIVVFNEQRELDADAQNAARRGLPAIQPLQMQSLHFGSPLFNVSRAFLAALNVDVTVKSAIEALQNNKKPVIFVESTLETLLKDLVDSGQLADGRMPDFKDVLHRVVTQLTKTRRRRGREAAVDINLAEQYPDLAVAVDEVRRMIDQMPDLGVSVLDIIRQRIEEAGFRCGEITGRKFEIVDGEVARRERVDKVVMKNRFNAGEIDALLINASGATGIDLHAGRRFLDQRQRVMFLLQTPGDIVKEMQGWGRVNRFDQTIGPIIATPQSGLPAEMRLSANRNAKLRRMSANVTSNRDSAALIGDVPDLVNSVGDMVCSRFAFARPDIMRRIGMGEELPDLKEDEEIVIGDDADDNKRSANTILSRLIMLSTAEQEQALEEITAEYYATLEELDANNSNPLRSKEIEGKVHMQERSVFEGADVDFEGRSAFDAPVYMDKIAIERSVDPMRFEKLVEEVERGNRMLAGETMHVFADRMERRREDVLSHLVPHGARNIAHALETAGPDSPLTKRVARFDRFIETLRMLEPGAEVSFTSDGEVLSGIITGIEPPRRGFEHITSMYKVFVQEAGESWPRLFFVDSLLSDEGFAVRPGLAGEDYDEIANRFDSAPEGTSYRAGVILTGNLFRAMEINVGFKIGSLATFEQANGVRDRAIMVSKRMRDLGFVPVRLLDEKMAASALREIRATLRSEDDLTNTGVVITVDGNRRVLHLPSPRSRKYAEIFEHPLIKALFDRAMQGQTKKRFNAIKVPIAPEEYQYVTAALYAKGVRFFIESRHRDWANDWIARNVRESEYGVAPLASEPIAPTLTAAE